jgi:hypothetical protein
MAALNIPERERNDVHEKEKGFGRQRALDAKCPPQ